MFKDPPLSSQTLCLTTTWFGVEWWNRGFRSVLKAPPLSSQTFCLTTTWFGVDWWNRGFRSVLQAPPLFLTTFPSDRHAVQCSLSLFQGHRCVRNYTLHLLLLLLPLLCFDEGIFTYTFRPRNFNSRRFNFHLHMVEYGFFNPGFLTHDV